MSGYRDFSPETIARLDFIRRGRAAGLTLAQIRGVLDIRDAQIADLQHLRATVSQLHDSVAAANPDTSDSSQVCRYL